MPAYSSESQHTIHQGPPADKVIDAFKYAFADRLESRLYVEFTISVSPRLTRPLLIQITALKYESGSEGMLVFEGNVINGSGTVEGHYNAKIRQGTLTLRR